MAGDGGKPGELQIRVRPNVAVGAEGHLGAHLGDLAQRLLDLSRDYHGVGVEIDTSDLYERPLGPDEIRLKKGQAPFDQLAIYVTGLLTHELTRAVDHLARIVGAWMKEHRRSDHDAEVAIYGPDGKVLKRISVRQVQ
jgi:hypothetical protein